MNISLKSILLILLLVPALTSCIRDEIEDCPPLQVNIAVKDKNYFNVDKVDMEERRSEDLAFREYVPTLFYMLRDAKTGEVMEEHGVFRVEGEAKTMKVDFCPCLPHGTYVLTVWGGMKDMTSLSEDRTALALHPEHAEGDDIYLVNDTLVYDAYRYDYTVEMERTKGKLIVEAEGLEQGLEHSTMKADHIYERVDSGFSYSSDTYASMQYDWTGQHVLTKTVLAPSLKRNGSTLSLQFYDSAQRLNPVLSPKDVRITMHRNELTVLRYVWNEEKADFVVYMLVNDNWEMVHGMEIE